MPKIRLVWRVDPEPTGKYSFVERRGWPFAYYRDSEREETAVALFCAKEYVPSLVREGKHPEIKIKIADHSVADNEEERAKYGSRRMRTLIQRAKTLKEAKEIAQGFLDQHPEFWPRSLRPKEDER